MNKIFKTKLNNVGKMKRELISFAAGAGMVGCIWAASAFCKTPADTSLPEVRENIQTTNQFRKSLSDVYSAKAEKRFPGLQLYDSDFLIPLNRFRISDILYFDDPNKSYGTAGRPIWNFVFTIEEKNKEHYFLANGFLNDGSVSMLVYLGENITFDKVEDFEICRLLLFHDKNGRKGGYKTYLSYIIPDSALDFEIDNGIAQQLQLDSLLKYAEEQDPFVHTVTPAQMWQLIQKSIRENDPMTIAKMIDFPMAFNGQRIYTRAEFVENFDEIFVPGHKEAILKRDASEIFFSWRGALLPDNCSWLRKADAEDDMAGALELNPDWWKKLNCKKNEK